MVFKLGAAERSLYVRRRGHFFLNCLPPPYIDNGGEKRKKKFDLTRSRLFPQWTLARWPPAVRWPGPRRPCPSWWMEIRTAACGSPKTRPAGWAHWWRWARPSGRYWPARCWTDSAERTRSCWAWYCPPCPGWSSGWFPTSTRSTPPGCWPASPSA